MVTDEQILKSVYDPNIITAENFPELLLQYCNANQSECPKFVSAKEPGCYNSSLFRPEGTEYYDDDKDDNDNDCNDDKGKKKKRARGLTFINLASCIWDGHKITL
jgi:hypothetical protein